MIWLRVFLLRLGGLFFKSRRDRELEEELRTHLEMQTEENVRRGMSREEARFAALRKFGGVDQVKEVYRDRRGLPAVETALQDVRHAARLFLRNPLITAVAVLTLALGIGANTAIFSVINAVILKELPYPEPDRLIVIWGKLKRVDQVEQSPDGFAALTERCQSFEQIAATERADFNLTGTGDPMRMEGQRSTANMFSTLGVLPLMGRTFTTEEDRDNARVTVLSYDVWQSRFAGDVSIIGRNIALNGGDYTIVGVMPTTFQFPAPIRNKVDLWTPRSLATERQRGAHNLLTIGRLKPGVTFKQASAELDNISRQRALEAGRAPDEMRVNPVPLTAQIGRQQRPALYVLAGAVGFVLLIACANVANLLLALAAGRRREMAVRLALGAQRGRIVRQLLTESLVLSTVGGALGLTLAVWLSGAIRVFAAGQLPRAESIALDGRVLVFTMLVSMLTGFIFGLAPSLQAARADLNPALKDGSRSATGALGQRLRGALVVVEIAMALVLLTGAGLMIKSFLRLQQIEPGFDPQNLLSLEINLPAAKYPNNDRRAAFFDQAVERISALPGVKGVALINHPPLSGRRGISIFPIEGRPEPKGLSDAPLADFRFVNPDYFRIMGIRLIEGRAFTDGDGQEAPKVALINRAYADRFAAGENLLGRRVRVGDEWHTLVGIVGDIRQSGLDEEAAPHVYAPYRQVNGSRAGLLVRTSGEPLAMVGAVRTRILAVDSEQPIYNVSTMTDLMSKSAAPRQLNLMLVGGFALLALALASAGIYGVIANLVTQRTGEIGLRMALGARPRNVLGLVVGHGMKLALSGVVAGVVGSLILTRTLSTLLVDVSATDPTIFAGVALLLAAVALLACLIPARRAMRVDPMVALRYE
ncbi:MAG: ABC transporter permease [Acidobacteriota bacterium]